MLPILMTVSEYKLTDLLSSAGATIGVIIAGTIFLQFLSTKYTELSGRFREMAGEYRGVSGEQDRHAPLRAQIQGYRRRLRLLNWASWLGAVALLFFLSAVMAGGFSLLYPPVRAIKAVGTFGLMAGLLLIAVAVFLELVESIVARKEIGDEIADFDDERGSCRHDTARPRPLSLNENRRQSSAIPAGQVHRHLARSRPIRSAALWKSRQSSRRSLAEAIDHGNNRSWSEDWCGSLPGWRVQRCHRDRAQRPRLVLWPTAPSRLTCPRTSSRPWRTPPGCRDRRS